ncbi:MAG: tripartite tricarboxylate transporter TctB family protein [Thermodesulfobacteriota bacterium]
MSASSALAGKRSLKYFLGQIKGIILIFLAAIYLYSLADKLEAFSPPGQLGPAFWPKISLILLMAGCLIKAGELFRERRRKFSQEEKNPPLPPVDIPRLIIMICLVIFSVVWMELLGFLLANSLFLLLFMRITGVKKKIPLLLTSALGTIFLLYLFVKIVYLPLPRGQGIFNDLTIYLYRLLHLI